MTGFRRAALALCLVPAFAAAQEESKSILVLDASGSMWGQIDGVAKITIAQGVVGDLLSSLPETQALGLTAYGHRTKGDCTDIQTLVEPGAASRDAIAPWSRATSTPPTSRTSTPTRRPRPRATSPRA